MEERSVVRTNGFEYPFHPFQVASWVVFSSDVLIYMVCAMPLLEHGTKFILVPCYVLSVVILVVSTAKATRCNPVDPHVPLGAETALAEEENDSMPFCGICTVTVYPRSKHCRVCNKCVDVFDHHCMWINNCVGKANYKVFFITISAVAVMIGIILGTVLYLLIAYIMDDTSFGERVEETPVLSALPKEFFLGLLLVLAAINVPLFVLDLQLVALHVFLMSQELTTYEYIMNKRSGLQRREECEEGAMDKYAGGSGSGGDSPKTKSNGKRSKIRTLPRCLDWIVFSKCGRRRRRAEAKAKKVQDDAEQGAGFTSTAAGACSHSQVAPEKLGSAADGENSGIAIGVPALAAADLHAQPEKIGFRSGGADGSRGGSPQPSASPNESPRAEFGRGGASSWSSSAPPKPASPSPEAAATKSPRPFGPTCGLPRSLDLQHAEPLHEQRHDPGPPVDSKSSLSSSVPNSSTGLLHRREDAGFAALPHDWKVEDRSASTDGITWKAGGRYVAPEVLDLREGPELTSTVVGQVSYGSSLAVWEVCRSTKPASGGALCAFVIVQDGPEQGQQGWVRCASNAVESSAGGGWPDARCSPLRAAEQITSGPDSSAGGSNASRPGGGGLTEPEAEAPPELPNHTLPGMSAHVLQLPSDCRVEEATPFGLLESGVAEDRLVDDSAALQAKAKDFRCNSCTCAPPPRIAPVDGEEDAPPFTRASSAPPPTASVPGHALMALPGTEQPTGLPQESPSPSHRMPDGYGDVEARGRVPRYLPPLHHSS